MLSNCLIESLKAKLKSPRRVKIHMMWHIEPDSIWPHFWWEKDGYAYSFVSVKKRRLQVFLFEGAVQERKLDLFLDFIESCQENYRRCKKKVG